MSPESAVLLSGNSSISGKDSPSPKQTPTTKLISSEHSIATSKTPLRANIREARESDVEKIRDLFIRVYGDDYPYSDIYDTDWLKKGVFDDETLFLVAEVGDVIVATGSVMLDAGGLNDLMGELGRLVAETSKRARGAAQALVAELLERIKGKVHFAFSETRTIHRGAQRLAEKFDWRPVGFEPLKHKLGRRENMMIYCSLQSRLARELRRNNPRIIPEVARLAQHALRSLELPVDVIVEDEVEGYPTNSSYQIERLHEAGVSPLLRIERGRVTNREIFGHFSLAQGFFRVSSSSAHYLVARHDAAVVGAIGFTHDPVDDRIRIFELIEFDDAVKGFLLASVDKLARDEFNAAYIEADISAYSPKIQRTFKRLGFFPVAYCPSMVFNNVERLDVVRMAKLCLPYDPGQMNLLETGKHVQNLVELGLEDRIIGMEITEATRNIAIFENLPDGDRHHLARIGLLKTHRANTRLISDGEDTDRLFILVEGAGEARKNGKVLGPIRPGEIFGEMGLVDTSKRVADVYLTEDSKVIEFQLARLERLLLSHPHIGVVVMRNLARSLSQRLRRVHNI